MYSLIITIAALLLCVVVLNFLKYFFISKMRIDDRDQKVKKYVRVCPLSFFVINDYRIL